MNRLFRLFRRDNAKAAGDIQAPGFLRVGLHPYMGEIPSRDLPDAQAELYQRLSWVYIAVTITAQTAAGTPFQVKQLTGEKTNAIENHPFELLLKAPNPMQSRFEFLEALIGFRALTGNAYIWLNRTGPDKPPAELWLIPPDRIEPVPDENLYLRGYQYDPGVGPLIPLEPWEICHMKRFHPRNRFVGLSPIESLAVIAQGDLAMSKWNTNFFDKNYAKPAGALAFADPIPEPQWEAMKAEIKEQHGGTERRMMMLRNAGKGGVSWIPMGVSQKDMEFLNARTFSKEEIFAAFAPGLSSMLAINATEANSKTGKATFSEMTIWPIHQAVAEKFTNDILPGYGEGLVGEFDDVRESDRQMDLKEQEIAFQVLTVKEIRERYYQLKPLGDERDDQLVSGATAAPPKEEPEPVVMPPTPPPAPPAAMVEETEETPEDDTTLRDDLLRWQRKLSKRAKADKPIDDVSFESDVIPAVLHAAIEGALSATRTTDEIRAVFDDALMWGAYP